MIIRIKSSTNPKKTYDVDTVELTCTCPAFTIRNKRQSPCKHINQALMDLSKSVNATDVTTDFISVIRANNDEMDFIKKYSEIELDYLVKTGQVFILKGKIHILE